MNNFRDSIACKSNDELMLKELERRDGIYSFIFHELETPKSKTKYSTYQRCLPMNTLRDSIECMSNDELMLKELERRDGIYSFIFHELEVPKGKTLLASEQHATHQGHLKLHSFEQFKDEPDQEQKHNHVASNSSACAIKLSCNVENAVPLPTRTMHNFQECLKPWSPPPTLVYDHPQLYAYMANCSFRVRVPPPRFSHVTAPLVRNRRHALKNSPEYKRACGMCLLNIPDLRGLFPYDPDVHAPFGGFQARKILIKYVD